MSKELCPGWLEPFRVCILRRLFRFYIRGTFLPDRWVRDRHRIVDSLPQDSTLGEQPSLEGASECSQVGRFTMKSGTSSFSQQSPAADAPGLGLRKEHYGHILQGGPVSVTWFEAITENYMDSRGRPRAVLKRIRQDYPVALHGVSLSVGSAFPEVPSREYLQRWKTLIDEMDPFLVSDHVCWTRTDSIQSHDLLPICYDDSWLSILCENIDRVQNYLGRTIALENVSSYVSWKSNGEMSEWDFLNLLCRRTGCGLLLDINNVVVNSHNHGFDAKKYIDSIEPEHVWQYHLAGHGRVKTLRFDTHGQYMQPEVQELFLDAWASIGPRPTLLERDQDIPGFQELQQELLSLSVFSNAGANGLKAETVISESNEADAFAHSCSIRERLAPQPGAVRESLPENYREATENGRRAEVMKLQKEVIRALFQGRMSGNLEHGLRGAGKPRLTVLESLDVYRQSVLSRLEESLQELYNPLFSSGVEGIHDLIREYIQKIPPVHHNLSDYGHGFAGFLRSMPPAHAGAQPHAAIQHALLSDVARFCFLFQRFFHGQRPGGSWILESRDLFSRDCALLSVDRRAYELWQEGRAEAHYALASGIANNGAVNAQSHSRKEDEPENLGQQNRDPFRLLLYRDQRGVVHSRVLPGLEGPLFARLLLWQNLDRAMEWLAVSYPEASENQVFSFFRFLAESGLYRQT